MSTLRRVVMRILGALGIGPKDERLDEEFRAHIDCLTEENLRAGMTPVEARRQAMLTFGPVESLKEQYRDQRGLPIVETISRDLRFAARSLRREPGFTALTIVMLGVGLGAATAMFSLVNGVLLNPLAFRQPDRLIVVNEVIPAVRHLYPALPVNAAHYLEWRKEARSLEAIALTYTTTANLTGVGEPERVDAAFVTPNLFRLLGVRPALGRDLRDDEEQVGRATVAVLSDTYWRRRFGADPSVLGRTIVLDGRTLSVVGILPAGFRMPNQNLFDARQSTRPEIQVFAPKVFSQADVTQTLGRHNYGVIARMRPGATREQVVAELETVQARIEAQAGEKVGLRAHVTPLLDAVVGGARRGLNVLMAAIGIVVLIICVNLANLLLARGERRSHEFAARSALGASRARLAGHAFAETAVLALAGGALALAIAWVAIGFLRSLGLPQIPRLDEVRLDGTVMLFTVGTVFLTAAIFGFLPAWRASRTDPQASLRPGGRGQADSRGGRRLRALLVAGEVALSVMLLCLAGLLTNSFVRLVRADKGFDAPTVLSVNLPLASAKYREDAAAEQFFRRLFDALEREPGIASYGVSSALPLQGETWVDRAARDASGGREAGTPVNTRFISADYFKTLGIPLLAGRTFVDADHGRQVSVISARLAAFLWPAQDPIGRKYTRGNDQWFEVIGVVGDVRADADKAPVVMVYRPYWEWPTAATALVARASGEANSIAASLRRAIRAADAEMGIPRMQTMADVLDESVAGRRFQLLLAGAFALMAMIVASLGIYAVVSYSVSRRTAEIGVRAALGASRSVLCGLVLRQSARPVLLGLLCGTVGALALGRTLDGLLYEIGGRDPITLAAAVGLLGTVGVTACLVPALRASRVSPVNALRYE
jgi:putative ABC transport system permease protein